MPDLIEENIIKVSDEEVKINPIEVFGPYDDFDSKENKIEGWEFNCD